VDTDFYARLGIRPVINAAGHYTVLGGSVPTPRVRAAMDIAASSMVDVLSLRSAVHAEVARLTRNEAAYVTSGAAAGLYLAVAAAVSSHYKMSIERVAQADIGRSRVLMPANGRNPYDVAIRQVGVELIQVEGGQDALARAITEDTVAVLHAVIGQADGMSTLRDSCAVAHDAGLPLIVDAAAQIPPASNLWEIPAAGADVVIFSGGKALGAPQSTGLMLGSASFIDGVDALAFPRHGYGRMFKVGRDQLVGALAALEDVLARDEVMWLASREAQVGRFLEAFRGNPLLEMTRGFPNIAGQPVPYVLVRPRSLTFDGRLLTERLRNGDPSIAVDRIPGHEGYAAGFIINTLALREEEVDQVISAIFAAIADHSVEREQATSS